MTNNTSSLYAMDGSELKDELEHFQMLMADISKNVSIEDRYLNKNKTELEQYEHLEYLLFSNNTMSQNTPTFEFAMVFLSINLCLMIPFIYFHILILRMTKREEKKNEQILLCKMLSIYAKVSPLLVLFLITNLHGIMSFIYPAAETFGTWYCYVTKFASYFTALYIGTISLLAAILRYYFIVHHNKGSNTGRENIIKKCVVIHIVISFVMSLIKLLSNGDGDSNQRLWANQCWGHNIEVSKLENDTLSGISNFFCVNRHYQIEYYIGAQFSKYFEPILRFFCGGSNLFYGLLLSNSVELVLYLMTLKHMDRCVLIF